MGYGTMRKTNLKW